MAARRDPTTTTAAPADRPEATGRARRNARYEGLVVAGGGAVAAAALAGSAVAGQGALAAVLVVAQVLLAWAWTSMLGATTGTMALVVAAAVASDVVLLVPDGAVVGDLVGVVGLAIVTTVLYQLARRRISIDVAGPTSPAGSPRVISDMAAALGGVGIVVVFASLLALRTNGGSSDPDEGYALVVAGLVGAGATVFVARCLDALIGSDAGRSPKTAGWTTLVGIAVATGAGAACGALTGSLTAGEAAAVGAAGAVAAAVADTALARSAPTATAAGSATPLTAATAAAAAGLAAVLPFAVAAPAVYLVGQVLLS